MNTQRTPLVKGAKARLSGSVSEVTAGGDPGGAPAGDRTLQTRAVRPLPSPTGGRALRFEQAVVTVVLLAGFVFRVPWVIPAVAVLLGAAAVAGPRANVFARSYEYLFFHGAARPDAAAPARRIAPEPAAITRVTRTVEVVLLLVASVLVALGAEGLAWAFALPVAAITGVAVTTGVNLVALVHDRSRRG
jgi:hypothetical protein